jgi:hypothetical protein
VTDWQNEALPVLEAVGRVSSSKVGWPFVRHDEVKRELGRPDEDDRTSRTLYDLARTGYLRETASTDQFLGPLEVELTEKGLALTSGWPAGGETLARAVVEAIERRIEAAESAEERSRLEKLRDGFRAVGYELAGELVAGALFGRF